MLLVCRHGDTALQGVVLLSSVKGKLVENRVGWFQNQQLSDKILFSLYKYYIFELVTTTLPSASEPKTYKHNKGKYYTLNPYNQTRANFVKGQKYKVGTGIMLVLTETQELKKIQVSSKSSYKKFLSHVLEKEIVDNNIVGIEWIPTRILKKNTLATFLKNNDCDAPCIDTCVKLGCICYNQ